MDQLWQKKGVVFDVQQNSEWMYSHASFPKAILLDDAIRVFFTTRDKNNRGRMGYIDVDKNDPMKVLHICKDPVLDLGEPGTFDDCGVTPSSAMHHDGKIYLYYHGWNALQLTPHRLTTGLAVSEDGGQTFQRYSRAPLFDRTDKEPIFSNNPCVYKEGNQWHMWYLNLEQWVPINGRFEGLFTLYYAHSNDGIQWNRNATVAINKKFDHECVSNATVTKEDGVFKMWYSYRSVEDFREGKGAYWVGYAESTDAKNWERMDDKVKLDRSEDGWDSVMLSFPSVITVGNKRHLFYNGNGFGKTGIGLATLEF
jgi:predicted GH43/DUF377 family glycosyl hydrolase